MPVPSVSIVLPTYNRQDRLRRVLQALERQSFPLARFDVCIVSDGSTDGTAEMMRVLESPLAITFVEQANLGPAVARNTALERATGELILFLDDDVVPSEELVASHVRSHTKDNLVVLGPMLSPADFTMRPWVRWEQAMLMKQYDDMTQGRWEPSPRQFYTGNASVARRWLLQTGGFDPAFRRAEDVELAYRLAGLGLNFVFARDAVGWHYAERSFDSWLETPYLYGRSDVIFGRDKGQPWLLRKLCTEYHGRHPLIRASTTLCLDRHVPSQLALALLRQAGRLPALSRVTFSGIFNLRYYQGFSDEIGGREAFFSCVAAARQTAVADGR